MRKAADLTRRYGVASVPAVVVNGKYRLDGQLLRGSNVGMLQVADWLVQRELAAL